MSTDFRHNETYDFKKGKNYIVSACFRYDEVYDFKRGKGEYGVYVFKRGPIVYEPRGLSCDLNSPYLFLQNKIFSQVIILL